MAGRFRWDWDGMGDFLRSPLMKAAMFEKAKKVKARAEATAPVDSGDYKSSFETSTGVKTSSTSGNRLAYERVTNTSTHARWVEYGGKNTPRHRTLGKALDAAKE